MVDVHFIENNDVACRLKANKIVIYNTNYKENHLLEAPLKSSYASNNIYTCFSTSVLLVIRF